MFMKSPYVFDKIAILKFLFWSQFNENNISRVYEMHRPLNRQLLTHTNVQKTVGQHTD